MKTSAYHWLALTVTTGLLAAAILLRQHPEFYAASPDPELLRLRLLHAKTKATSSDHGTKQKGRRPWTIPTGWSKQALPNYHSAHESWQLESNPNPSWREFVELIGQLSASPGIRIQSLQIRSRGTRLHRKIAGITIVLDYPNPTPPRAVVADGAVFSGSNDAAISPAVVPGAPARLPSASAQPPAPVRLAALAVPTLGAPGRNFSN
ncbi:MAG: hypothetical protein H7A44_08460 [Opitutaceae bacterium]|nr:hypothetical protein [Cephaloticoccus sp.]MCP5530462.1 hypothetical protein [Opitutaceae bacterium]